MSCTLLFAAPSNAMTSEEKQKLNTKVTINIKAVKLSKFAEWVRKKSGLKVKIVADDMTLIGESHVKSPLITIIKSTLGKHGLSCGYSKKSGLVFYKKENKSAKSPQKENKVAKSSQKENKAAQAPQKEIKVAQAPQKEIKVAKLPQKEYKLPQAKEIKELTLLSPENGATIYVPHPHLHWQKKSGTNIEDYYRIQVASDEAFQSLVIDDKIDAVSRLVSVKPLPTGKYFWRVRREDEQQWSKVFSFTRGESKVYPIKKGSTQQEIVAVLNEAAANTPARVLFEKGDYLITEIIPLEKVKDLIIDGNGSKLILGSRFVELNLTADITFCNMTVTPKREASTNVDILEVDPKAQMLLVQTQPGFPQDFHNYFVIGKSNTIMRIANKKQRGLAVVGFGPRGKKRMDDLGNGRYRIHGIDVKDLEEIRPGMTGYAKTYTGGFGKAYYVKRTTFSKVNFMGMGGTIWMGSGKEANSSLSCGFLPLTPKHLTGASGIIGKGRTGSWYEDCRFEMCADDNTMDHQNPIGVADIQGNVLTLADRWPWKQEIGKGEELVLWDLMSGEAGAATSVTILEALDGAGKPTEIKDLSFQSPKTLVLSKNAAELNRELGRPEGTSFKAPSGKTSSKALDKMVLLRLSHSNRDFVFRHNEVTGGSAGLLNNTSRSLVAHNIFRNLRGYGVNAGYQAAANEFPIAGAGSRDYVIRDNTMVNVGRTAIKSSAKHKHGRNIIIKNNTISYTEDRVPNYGIIVGNMPGSVVKDNLFKCPLPPEKGAWINAGSGTQCSNNRAEPEHPGVQIVLDKELQKSKKKKARKKKGKKKK